MKRILVLTVAGMALMASEARADIVVFKNGRSMSVKSCRIEAESATMFLREGGEVTFPSNVIARVDPDVSAAALPEDGESPAVQRVRTRLRVLQEVTRALAGKVDTPAVLRAVVDRVTRLVRAERAFAFVVDGESQALVPVVALGIDGRGTHEVAAADLSQAVLDRLLQERVAVMVDEGQGEASPAGSPGTSPHWSARSICVTSRSSATPWAGRSSSRSRGWSRSACARS